MCLRYVPAIYLLWDVNPGGRGIIHGTVLGGLPRAVPTGHHHIKSCSISAYRLKSFRREIYRTEGYEDGTPIRKLQ